MRRAQQPTPGFPPGESHGQRSLAGTVPRVAKSQTRLRDLAHMHTPIASLRVTKSNHLISDEYQS